MSYLTLDLETTTRTLYKRKASPFCKDNWIVMAGWKRPGQACCSRYFGAERPPDGLLAELLTPDVKILFGINIKFDIQHLIHNRPIDYAAWQEWVAAGGQIFCGQLAEYLCEGMTQQNHMLSMDEIAPRYGGNVKVDEVKELWAAGVQTEDIDPELLRRYLCGGKDEDGVEQLGDLGNTELICLAQIKRARASGQLQSIQLNMGSLLASIEMELNGMKVDMQLGLKLAAELQAQIDELHASLAQYLPADLPFEFKWTSRFHKSALIFGGTVQYEDKEYVHADGSGTLCREWDAMNLSMCAGAECKPLTYPMLDARRPVLSADGEPVRYKSGKNAGEIKYTTAKVPDLSRPKTRKCKAPYTFPRLTEPKPSWESAEPGVYSVSSDVIEELGVRGIPFLTALAKLQAASKDLGTYYLTGAGDDAKGMLTLVGEDGIIHHGINHCSTVTGRFSSSNPNLQNLPKGKKSDVKTVFVSRYPGGEILQSDFSALEVYVQAVLTGCKQLIADLRAGIDMHCLRLATKEGMPYAEVYRLCKGYTAEDGTKVPPVPEWDSKRTDSKVFSFRRAYGAGAATIAAGTGIPLADVEALIAAEEAMFPEIPAHFAAVALEIKKTRKPSGITIPHPDLPGVMCSLGKGQSRTPDGCIYTYIESPAPAYLCRKGITSSFSPTQILNYSVQGTGATVMKAAMWLAVQAMYHNKNFGGKAVLVSTVHDALYIDCHPAVKDEVFALLHECMEQATEFLRRLFKWDWPVDVPSDTSCGPSMAVEGPYEPQQTSVTWAKAQVFSEIKRITRTN